MDVLMNFRGSFFHRLGPACTATSDTPITTTLTVLITTVTSLQNHRLTVYLGTTIRTGWTMRRKNSAQPSSHNRDESAMCQNERGQHDDCMDSASTRRPSRMTLHRWRVLVMTSLPSADGSALPDAKLAAANVEHV